ncbi:MAG: cobalamin biosynthesis protein P47K [Planctomycetaceae bacterium]|nr:cobalamin biosynthesis protein P47K [Planctomycetaceae bacterium]
MLKPRYIMVGGFLGAGKTTAILKAAELLQARGERVGLITNDQSYGLVDTAMLNSHGFATEEITGGCFCCKFNSLVEAADKLNETTQPNMFIAEPVGSCTDLRSTVSYPLTQMYGDNFTIAPLSVLVDPVRAQQILGLKSGKTFSQKVLYIYEKQLEEADIIVVNKTDLLTDDERDRLVEAVESRWPQAKVMTMSARGSDGVEEWLEAVFSTDLDSIPSMEVDYDIYADGEALLGWLNLQATADGDDFDGNRWLLDLAGHLQTRLSAEGAEIAHLKMTLTPDQGRDIAVANLVRGEATAELSHQLAESLDTGELLLNLRAEGDPELLRELVLQSLREMGEAGTLNVQITSVEAFRPGRPTPTHRVVI